MPAWLVTDLAWWLVTCCVCTVVLTVMFIRDDRRVAALYDQEAER